MTKSQASPNDNLVFFNSLRDVRHKFQSRFYSIRYGSGYYVARTVEPADYTDYRLHDERRKDARCTMMQYAIDNKALIESDGNDVCVLAELK